MTDDQRPPVEGTTTPSHGEEPGYNMGDPTLYGPTTFSPITGQHFSAADSRQPDEPTVASVDEPTIAAASLDEPTIAEATQPDPAAPTSLDEATVAEPGAADDEPTAATGTDDPTTTGPTVGGWPLDQFEPPPPGELIWQPETPVEAPTATRSPAYYISLGAAVVIVVGLLAFAALVSVKRPQQVVAGSGSAEVPLITTTSGQPPPTTTSTQAGPNPFAELAAHPLSTATVRMPDATCALPRFDPADDQQGQFYAAAKVCADAAWRPVLREARLEGTVTVITLTSAVKTPSCGELTPTSPPTQCDGTVYLTPAYLRDTEQNGRYPGRYLGVFLREYARALQYTTGIDQLVTDMPNADVDARLDQQATCLAGMTTGAMSGRGAVDSNITNEIRDRLSSVDEPPDARSWLDKGFQQRTPAACNAWT
jgi:predicted metalloprotease